MIHWFYNIRVSDINFCQIILKDIYKIVWGKIYTKFRLAWNISVHRHCIEFAKQTKIYLQLKQFLKVQHCIGKRWRVRLLVTNGFQPIEKTTKIYWIVPKGHLTQLYWICWIGCFKVSNSSQESKRKIPDTIVTINRIRKNKIRGSVVIWKSTVNEMAKNTQNNTTFLNDGNRK